MCLRENFLLDFIFIGTAERRGFWSSEIFLDYLKDERAWADRLGLKQLEKNPQPKI